ncbi:hypothetical protein [Exiguobacterium sp. AM39-5BH]|uniref:hypothetical protein n=1 Tax=Exiguobacterium sp. AM39-5BH TaxID=2292355 RepID=UPI001313EAA9|nr:hypothetical protein [Exiguobacterium sp. AM39-5BH]
MNRPSTSLTIAIRRQLVLSGHSTIAAISEATRVSFPTVKKQLEQLIEAGEVCEQGFEDSSGGRPAKRYVYNAHFTHGLTLYVEKTVIRYRVIDCLGTTIDEGTQVILKEDHLGTLDGARSSIEPDAKCECDVHRSRGGRRGRDGHLRAGLSDVRTP